MIQRVSGFLAVGLAAFSTGSAQAQSCPAPSTARDMPMAFRDLGVMLHHTRDPFRLTPQDYAALVEGDSNWTGQSFQAGFRGANLLEDTIRFARSDGRVERFGDEGVSLQTPDVVMAVVEVRAANPTRMCQREEVCVVSYRGTDREHILHGDAYREDTLLDVVAGEGNVPLNDRGRRSFGCEIKEGYLFNYRETAPAVREFLFDMVDENRCSGGIVFMGMSLGGATADVAAAAYMLDRPRRFDHERLEMMRSAGNMWAVTAGAPRALGERCADQLHTDWRTHKYRFIYGDFELERERGQPQACPLFIDPVPGNPTDITMQDDLGQTVALSHWGVPIVGVLEPPERDARHVNVEDLRRCGELCESRAFAQANSRVVSDTARLRTAVGQNYGGDCGGGDLIPLREWQFGRFHDTCSYRNLMAFYGETENGETGFDNFQCRICGDDEDPSDYPEAIRIRDGQRGQVELTQFGPAQLTGGNSCPAQ